MFQIFDRLPDGDMRPISNEKDTLLECIQLVETIYWIFTVAKSENNEDVLKIQFDSSRYGVYERNEENGWDEVGKAK